MPHLSTQPHIPTAHSHGLDRVWAEWDRRGVFGGKEEEGGGGLGQERLVRSGQKYSRGISDGLIFVSHLT